MRRSMPVFRCLVLGVLVFASARAMSQEKFQTRVSITSQPSGATVIIDGMDRGVTPITLLDLSPGRHILKYRLAGYVERDRIIDMTHGPYIEKNEVLEEEKGLLLLKTDPSDCDVQIDGVSVGRTPKLVTWLPVSGSYNVKLRKAGYLPQSINVKFDGRKPLVREEKLVSASGTIKIVTEPAGAEVMVNGISHGVSPVTVAEVPKGRSTVKFHLDGFADETRELLVNAGDVQTLSIELKGLPGTLHLISNPDGARFYVNNEARGKGPVTIPGLPQGEYLVRAELDGYGTMSRMIKIGNGESVREEFKLSNMMGRIELRTCPVGAQVFLDGKLCGTTRGKDPSAEFSDIFEIENVMEGEHTLVLKADGFADLVRHPKVQSTKTLRHQVRLSRIFTPNVEIVTSRGTYKGVLKANRATEIEIEVSMGITRSFPRDEIRKVTLLNSDK